MEKTKLEHDLALERSGEDKVNFGKRQREESEMDMTPMVDVTFLLLIFFMVTASFSLQKAIAIPKSSLNEPSSARPKQPEEDTDSITVIVDQYNTFHVQTLDHEIECPSVQEMIIQLRQAKQGNSAGVVPTKLIVKAHVDALYEKVVNALDAGMQVGMNQLQLMKVEEDFEF